MTVLQPHRRALHFGVGQRNLNGVLPVQETISAVGVAAACKRPLTSMARTHLGLLAINFHSVVVNCFHILTTEMQIATSWQQIRRLRQKDWAGAMNRRFQALHRIITRHSRKWLPGTALHAESSQYSSKLNAALKQLVARCVFAIQTSESAATRHTRRLHRPSIVAKALRDVYLEKGWGSRASIPDSDTCSGTSPRSPDKCIGAV